MNIGVNVANSVVTGGVGVDFITASTGPNVRLFGGDGNDLVAGFGNGGTGIVIRGDAGDDYVYLSVEGSVPEAVLHGGSGDDSVVLAGPADGAPIPVQGRTVILNGGEGTDLGSTDLPNAVRRISIETS